MILICALHIPNCIWFLKSVYRLLNGYSNYYLPASNNIDIPSTSDITEEPSASTNNNYKQVKLARPAISTSASSSSLQMYITPPDVSVCLKDYS